MHACLYVQVSGGWGLGGREREKAQTCEHVIERRCVCVLRATGVEGERDLVEGERDLVRARPCASVKECKPSSKHARRQGKEHASKENNMCMLEATRERDRADSNTAGDRERERERKKICKTAKDVQNGLLDCANS